MGSKLLYGELTEKIIGAAFAVHNALGRGLREKTYENALVMKLRELGYRADQQPSLPVFFGGKIIAKQEVDILVEDKIIIETKAVKRLTSEHASQLLSYLKNTKYEVGLLINFGSRVEFKRFIYSSQRKPNSLFLLSF